ncbi:hypothetical protein PR202_gb24007 [Eleusine coracana subsp. coracana]|uniref:Uncharacterized protein n=1 Tax=Eleusine coracana subsp. coracana TaxID=191504 RepID=A0AAV5FKE5_ELECO|nr:hypothetical protein PR202_gb24007 [Eleusine coracana subsp. coracana]
MPAISPHALLLLLAALLLAASTSPVAAGEMAFVGAARADARETATWQRRLEDAVAPEFPSAAVRGGGIGYSPLIPQQPQCIHNCAAKVPGSSYTRACLAIYRCH